MIRVFCECNSTPNCFQDSASGLHCGSCLCCRLTGDHPIIGVPRQLISSQPHLPIKRRQKYVAERGRSHSPYTKGNFEFERVVRGWRTRFSVLDCRRKKSYIYDTWLGLPKRTRLGS